jgi:hypothetical protein
MKSFNSIRSLAALLCATALASGSWAQAKPEAEPDMSKYKVVIGTGGPGGTYDVMVGKELMSQCRRDDTTFGVINRKGGTIANIDNILANKQDAGVGQEDVLFLKKSVNPEVNQLKVLFTLHPEEIHVFVNRNTGLRHPDVVTSKYMGFKEDRVPGASIVFNFVEELASYKLGAWGGSYDTARLIRAKGGINYEPVQYPDEASAFTALSKGAVQGILAVAGAPAQNFEGIKDPNLKLVGFKPDTTMKLADIYSGGSVLNYTNLNSEGIQTVSTNAVLFTREFSDPSILKALSELKGCYTHAVGKLRDTRGAHKKWRQVKVESKSKWPMYDLPIVAARPAGKK